MGTLNKKCLLLFACMATGNITFGSSMTRCLPAITSRIRTSSIKLSEKPVESGFYTDSTKSNIYFSFKGKEYLVKTLVRMGEGVSQSTDLIGKPIYVGGVQEESLILGSEGKNFLMLLMDKDTEAADGDIGSDYKFKLFPLEESDIVRMQDLKVGEETIIAQGSLSVYYPIRSSINPYLKVQTTSDEYVLPWSKSSVGFIPTRILPKPVRLLTLYSLTILDSSRNKIDGGFYFNSRAEDFVGRVYFKSKADTYVVENLIMSPDSKKRKLLIKDRINTVQIDKGIYSKTDGVAPSLIVSKSADGSNAYYLMLVISDEDTRFGTIENTFSPGYSFKLFTLTNQDLEKLSQLQKDGTYQINSKSLTITSDGQQLLVSPSEKEQELPKVTEPKPELKKQGSEASSTPSQQPPLAPPFEPPTSLSK